MQHWADEVGQQPDAEPALVPEPVRDIPSDDFDVPPGPERDKIIADLCLQEVYEGDRCGSIIKVPVHSKHSDLYTEYKTSKSVDEKFADCHSVENKKFKSFDVK